MFGHVVLEGIYFENIHFTRRNFTKYRRFSNIFWNVIRSSWRLYETLSQYVYLHWLTFNLSETVAKTTKIDFWKCSRQASKCTSLQTCEPSIYLCGCKKLNFEVSFPSSDRWLVAVWFWRVSDESKWSNSKSMICTLAQYLFENLCLGIFAPYLVKHGTAPKTHL